MVIDSDFRFFSFNFEWQRSLQGYHDEPLKGERFGQRSVRLSRSYRLFYRQTGDGQYEIIEVLEVNKHDY